MDTLISVLDGLHFDLTAFIAQLLIFVIFHFCLRAILVDRMLEVRNKRDGQIEGRVAQAEQMAANARRLKEEYDEKMRALRLDLNKTLTEQLAAAEKEAASLRDEARQKASKIREEVMTRVEGERSKLETEMEARADSLARAIGKKVVETNLSADGASRVLSRLGS